MKNNPKKTRTPAESYIYNWLPIELALCPPFILQRLGKDKLQQQLTQSIQESFDYSTKDSLLEPQYKYCKVPGTKVEDYKYRNLSTPLGDLVTSMRFLGGDLSKPFVSIMHKDFELRQPEDIQQLAQLLKKEYAIFKPERIRWYSSQIENELIQQHDFLAGDMLYITEFSDQLKQLPFPKKWDEVELRLATHLDWYDTYTTAFQELVTDWPAFDEMAQTESKKTLQMLIDNQWLFEIWIANEFAGIIGANRGENKYLSGLVIYEEFVLKKFRGQGFAPAIQRKMLENIPSKENDMLFGTIHYENIPSQKTALRVGRKAVGMDVFSKI